MKKKRIMTSFPVRILAVSIPGLLAGAKDLEAGKLTPQEPPWEMPCKLYRCDVAAFCY